MGTIMKVTHLNVLFHLRYIPLLSFLAPLSPGVDFILRLRLRRLSCPPGAKLTFSIFKLIPASADIDVTRF